VQIYRFSGVLPRFRARIDQSTGPTADMRKLAAFSFFFFRGTFFLFQQMNLRGFCPMGDPMFCIEKTSPLSF
jgi:hypothetical protein